MAHYLRADCTSADAWVWKALAPNQYGLDEVYISCDFYFCPSLITYIDYTLIETVSPQLMSVYDLYGLGGHTYPDTDPSTFEDAGYEDWVQLGQDSGLNPTGYPCTTGYDTLQLGWEIGGSEVPAPMERGVPATPGAHIVQVHYILSADVYQWKIDGVLYDYSGLGIFPGAMSQADVIAVGGVASPLYPVDFVYCSQVLVGTTGWGSSDVFSDDFSSGLTAWDGTVGACTVVGLPDCFVVPPTPPLPGILYESDGAQWTVVGQMSPPVGAVYLSDGVSWQQVCPNVYTGLSGALNASEGLTWQQILSG